MLKVGLTGGIGSGKTTVAKIFEVLCIPVYYADDTAKKLMDEDENVKTAIIKSFRKMPIKKASSIENLSPILFLIMLISSHC